MLSPADGAVTAAENDAFRLRTGDGLELEVLLPCGAEYFVQTGDMARAGEPVCRISSEELRREKAVVKVQFTDSSRREGQSCPLWVPRTPGQDPPDVRLPGKNAPEPPPLNTPRETHSKKETLVDLLCCLFLGYFLITSSTLSTVSFDSMKLSSELSTPLTYQDRVSLSLVALLASSRCLMEPLMSSS